MSYTLPPIHTSICVQFTVEGIHSWPDCDIEQVSYLAYSHRHTFHFKCFLSVYHDDRDKEFLKWKDTLRTFITTEYYNESFKLCDFSHHSCEQLAKFLLENFHPDNLYRVEVFEDNENGAIVELQKPFKKLKEHDTGQDITVDVDPQIINKIALKVFKDITYTSSYTNIIECIQHIRSQFMDNPSLYKALKRWTKHHLTKESYFVFKRDFKQTDSYELALKHALFNEGAIQAIKRQIKRKQKQENT